MEAVRQQTPEIFNGLSVDQERRWYHIFCRSMKTFQSNMSESVGLEQNYKSNVQKEQ